MARQLFIADWTDVLFMHLRVLPAALANEVPLELDLHNGDAYVSLVAFTQKRLRPSLPFAGLLTAPLAHHEFFNVRTYVRRPDGTRGIFFLAEWIPNRLAASIGPRMYGLPYRLGRLRYQNDWSRRAFRGEVSSRGARVRYRASPRSRDLRITTPNTLDHFLLERYVAFTHRGSLVRRFDVAHEPWPQVPADAELLDTSLLQYSGNWTNHAQLVAANYSPGVCDVAISAPSPVAAPPPRLTNRPPTASRFPAAAPALHNR